MTSSAVIPTLLILLSCAIIECWSGFGGENAPPILNLDRKWLIEDKEPVGSVVARVRGSDSEGDPLVYGLEHHRDFATDLVPADTRPLPFTIDPDTGVVRTNQSLMHLGGQQLYLYVTVNDGHLTQKSAVWVSVVNSSAPAQSRTSLPFPRHPAATKLTPPPQLVPFQRFPVPPAVAPPRPAAAPRPDAPPPPPSTSTSTENTAAGRATVTSVSTSQPPSSTPSPAVPSPVAPAPTVMDLALTIVPVAIVCIMFGLAAITAFLFRKRLCKKYKASKKNSSEIKKKKKKKQADGGGREDSMVMQQWSGPTAHSNRYEPPAPAPAPESNPLHHPPAQPAPGVPEKSGGAAVDRWEYPRHQLKVFNILGEGCFGQVWKCQANNIDGNEGATIVAVKTLKENAGERERADLLQELQVMKCLEPHPNVVRLIGCCTDKDPIFVIMEYVSKGKLQSLLRNSRAQRCYDNLHGKSASLTSRNLTSFCYQVARGMHFLSNKGIIHRDLAARNVLVGDDMTCKVADFGFARDILASHVYERKSEGRLPIRWMAPESLYDNLFSVKSDVWSFGVLIWEVVTLGSTPYPGLSAGEVMKRVRDGYRLDKPEHCRRELYNIMYYCWDDEPAKRPDFPEIASLLEQLLLSETDYIELQHFPDHSYYNIVSLSGEKL